MLSGRDPNAQRAMGETALGLRSQVLVRRSSASRGALRAAVLTPAPACKFLKNLTTDRGPRDSRGVSTSEQSCSSGTLSKRHRSEGSLMGRPLRNAGHVLPQSSVPDALLSQPDFQDAIDESQDWSPEAHAATSVWVRALEMRVAISSADPDDRRRRFEMKSFEIVSKDTGEAVSATITPILEVADSEEQSPSERGVTEAKPTG